MRGSDCNEEYTDDEDDEEGYSGSKEHQLLPSFLLPEDFDTTEAEKLADKIIEGLNVKHRNDLRWVKTIYKMTFSQVFPEILNKFNRTFKKHDIDK